MIKIEELKNKLESLGYVATDELIYDTFNALCMFNDSEINPGQDIYAICLEGPPGAGKTEFAKTYTKICSELFDNNVEMVDYQCDATTGKTELFEDINISAAIRGDADNVNIPGKLIEAIKKVNSGKKVILFIDEYDKAREETDAFLLQFLQSGKINSTQHGDLEVKEEYKANLQVILCKNDMREELSGPLSRRIRIIRLDYMEPSTLLKVANRSLCENLPESKRVSEGLINLVTLMYQQAYDEKEIYNRLPSCSEMLIAIQDADRLIKRANAPQNIVYNSIIRNMFKSPDDITTFESSLSKTNRRDNKLANLIKTMKETKTETFEKESINELIAKHVLVDTSKELQQKIDACKSLISEYKTKFTEMQTKLEEYEEKRIRKIELETGALVSKNNSNKVRRLFEDETTNIKRGYNIFETSYNEWTNIGTISFEHISHSLLIQKLIEYANDLNIKIYENGILLKDENDIKLILTIEDTQDNKMIYRLLCNYHILPSSYLTDIENFINFSKDVAITSPVKTGRQIVREVIDLRLGSFNISTLVYNETPLTGNKVTDDVYHYENNSNITKDDISLSSNISCVHPEAIKEISESIKEKGAILKHGKN